MMKDRRILKWSLWTLAILLLIRVFLYQVAGINNFSMASTLLPGDRVIVNKWRAGLRLPISIIGLPGTGSWYADGIRLPYMRLPAIKKLRKQEVVVFNNPVGTDEPIDRKRLMFGRIVGLPTDTVMIKDKEVFINHVLLSKPVLARSQYRIVTEGQPVGKDFLHKYDIEQPATVASIGIFDADLSKEASEALANMTGVKTVRETMQYMGDASQDYYPRSNFFMWNRDQYGPIMVPYKGMTVEINIKTIDFYRDLIENKEGHEVMVDFAGIHIDGKEANSYTFEKNYYYVLSDNRDQASDSRKYGFVPADHIVGVAKRIIWSGQHTYDYIRKLHPGRILKRIR